MINGDPQLLLLPGTASAPVMGEVKRLIDWLNAQGIAHSETEKAGWRLAYDASKQRLRTTMAQAMAADAVIFGAVGGRSGTAPYEARPEAGLCGCARISVCSPTRGGVLSGAGGGISLKREIVEGLDIMIVRELTGGVISTSQTITDLGNGQKRAVDTQVYDTYEIERIARVAFESGAQTPQRLTRWKSATS